MNFVVFKYSNVEHRETVEINSLEELVNFIEKIPDPVIVEKLYNFETDIRENALIIYDDWLE